MLGIIVKKHGGVSLQFSQQFPGAAIARKDTGKLYIEGFKGSQGQLDQIATAKGLTINNIEHLRTEI